MSKLKNDIKKALDNGCADAEELALELKRDKADVLFALAALRKEGAVYLVTAELGKPSIWQMWVPF